MSPLLEEYGVAVVAISRDTPEEAAAQRVRDGLRFILLSDPRLSVITRFGLLHEGAIRFRTFLIGGARFPLGWPVGFQRMAIPTTLLLDADHTVRWIDQADDYRIRGDAERTRAALLRTFGPPAA
jgi:alkyl hydroperoxide reductase subunit AhpC